MVVGCVNGGDFGEFVKCVDDLIGCVFFDFDCYEFVNWYCNCIGVQDYGVVQDVVVVFYVFYVGVNCGLGNVQFDCKIGNVVMGVVLQ